MFSSQKLEGIAHFNLADIQEKEFRIYDLFS